VGLQAATLTQTVVLGDGTAAPETPDPRFGKIIHLSDSPGVRMHLESNMAMDGGTISFWIRPAWETNSTMSHTLMSGRWRDPRQSYFAISEGWWEPGGSGRLYFVASNEDLVHCSSEMRLPTQTWSLVTVTWASGRPGFCKLYVDDELRAAAERPWAGGKVLETIELGSDAAATNSRGRTARGDIAGLKILAYPVTQRDVMARYTAEETPAALYDKKWAWLDSGIGGGLAAGAPSALPAAAFKRAIFDEDMAWAVSPGAIDERLRRLADAGFNIYVPCVWHGRGTLFPSRAAPPDRRFESRFAAGWDPLSYLVKQAHARKIAVYPWLTVVRREDDAHPEWADPGTPPVAYDVHQAGFREFAERLMLDIVTRYEVDGINLDYIRAMGVCVSPSCQRSYRSETGSDLLADFSGGAPNAQARRRIEGWQDAAVGTIVRDFSARAHALKPRLVISIDGYAVRSSEERPLEGRDEVSWANHDWIDVIFQMNYRPEPDTAAYRAARAELADASKLWQLVSDFDVIDGSPAPRSGEWLSKVVDFERVGEAAHGVGVYLYGLLSDAQIEALRAMTPAPSTPNAGRPRQDADQSDRLVDR
jgi:hypothetical protein